MKKAIILICLIVFNAFSQTSPTVFDIEGHRGARGLVPENTIPSFLKAIELGVDTIELDLVVSRDNKLVVSHEPWFSSAISLDKNGQLIPADKQKEYNLYKMNYSEIKKYDVGSIGNKDFPAQQKMKVYKPLLKDVFKETQKYVRKNKLKPVRYNIEIKTVPQGENLYHPAYADYAKLVYDEILANKMEKRVIVQSFDVRALQEIRKLPVKLPIALLVQNKEGVERNVEKLGFQPEVYSPHFSLIDETTMQYCRQKGIKVIPWTINEIADMENLKKFNLDGIITDYPDRAIKVYRK